jgi:outer membrane protein assembly factor BamE (lipoprotein component of BamABCDE complex)
MRFVKPIFLLAAAAIFTAGCANVPTPRYSGMNDSRFAAIEPGMTAEQVTAALGAPERTMKFPSSNVAWDYTGTDTWGYMVDYSVTFGPDQRVVSKFARRINDGGDHGH